MTPSNVVPLPVEHAAASASHAVHEAELRFSGRFEVDDWGRDEGFVQLVGLGARTRWSVNVGGIDHLPRRTGALVVTNARSLALTAVMVAWALGNESGRPVRFVGRHDHAPLGAIARRLGGLLEHPDEVAGALRHHEIVVVGTHTVRQVRRAGAVSVPFVAAALRTDVPVLPAAAVSSPFSRHARVELAAPVRPPRGRRGPLAEVELAEHLRRRLQDLLDEMGGAPVLDLIGEA